jgi:UDP-N-acetylmuramyl tripeptide synthase
LPFDNSRRLTGSNLFFDSAGAVLETAVELDESLLAGWRSRVLRARASLRWADFRPDADPQSSLPATPGSRAAVRARSSAIRRHAAGTSLALAAPFDQLFTATEVNEWALCAALLEADPVRWSHLEATLIEVAREAATQSTDSSSSDGRIPIPVAFAAALPVLDERAAFTRFTTLSKIEAAPRSRALVDAADSRHLLHVLDDDYLTLGSGAGGRTWPVDALPDVTQVPWNELRDVPIVIVTGSNGKTTTVRLLAACCRAHGWRDGYNCTDGLFVGAEQIETGDYSGPVGTRTVLRDTRVEAAILETARGGILRRGLAAQRARVAVVTNVSADHFGEYGIDDLAGLADTKLVVASTIGDTGLVVLNADDPVLRARAAQLSCPIGWFSRDYDDSMLNAHRKQGSATSGVRDGRLIVAWSRGVGVEEFDLGAVADMPLTIDGSADYNVSNVAGVALAALGLGFSHTTIATVLARFGANPADNPGRLMRYDHHGAQVLIDYAHNPEGLAGLMNVAARLRRTGRIALLLGQAGNRANADIERLAATAASFRPDFVVIKETGAYLRGRAPGEVPAILRAALVQAGLPESALEVCPSELAAVRRVLEWSRSGDVLVMPVHDRMVRAEALALISPP